MKWRRKNKPILHYAARLILEARDSRERSAPRGTLIRLEQIAREPEKIEDRLASS